jgi:hypothetical protein
MGQLLFVIENHMFCSIIRLQINNMPETRLCCRGVLGSLREQWILWFALFPKLEIRVVAKPLARGPNFHAVFAPEQATLSFRK